MQIEESIFSHEVSLEAWEFLLLNGWDRVGANFFRRRFDNMPNPFLAVQDARLELMPLRYDLSGFEFTRKQRNLFKKNSDLRCVVSPTELTPEKYALFDRWYAYRFKTVADLTNWVSPDNHPFPTYELSVFKGDTLIACSFFDVTRHCQYSTTAFYEPDEAHRSLGTLTLLCEILHGIQQGKRYHFPGHAYHQPSPYDYKKKMQNIEFLNYKSFRWEKME